MKTISIILLIMLGTACSMMAQEKDTTAAVDRSNLLNVYLDCGHCDLDYFRENFTEVNYVTEPSASDVHIQVTEMPTGSGGSEFTALYTGKKRYLWLSDTVTFSVPVMSTEDETRETMLNYIQLGLVPYMLKSPSRDRLMLLIHDSPVAQTAHDPWKNWMCMISGSGSYMNQKTLTDLYLNASIMISKVTPKIKFESLSNLFYNETEIKQSDGEKMQTTEFIIQKNIFSRTLLVKSLGKHWGIGAVGSFNMSNYFNLDYQLAVGPAVEYNVFDYAQASRKQLLFHYYLYYQYSDYKVLTQYGRMKDELIRNELGVRYSHLDQWGNVSASAWGRACYVDQLHYAAGADLQVSVMPFQDKSGLSGLSLNIYGGVSYSRDQLSLRSNAADSETSYFWAQEMETGLKYNIGIGISYRFGSKNNNTVNSRFCF